MIKKFCFVLLVIAGIAALVFYDQVLSVFAGMSVLESLKLIVTFVLHVTIGTVAVVILYQLLEFLEPIIKAGKVVWRAVIRQKRRSWRRGLPLFHRKESVKPILARKPSKDQALINAIVQLAKNNSSKSTPPQLPAPRDEGEHIHLDW